jgi:sulfur dioxygenase
LIVDVHVQDGEGISFGEHSIVCLSTPGHTLGCMSFFLPPSDGSHGAVFTGDTLLIRGCGRTDFQGGSSENLYNSVISKLFTLPDDTLVYPAHDYKVFFALPALVHMQSIYTIAIYFFQ